MEKYGYTDEGIEELTDGVCVALDEIGKEVFRVDTLDEQKSDSLDFHDASVWSMREAMKRAYLLGKSEE